MSNKSRIEQAKAYQDDKYTKSWLVGLSERTRLNYLEGFADFFAFMNMTTTQMIEKRLKDTRSDSMAERMYFEQKFREYKLHFENRGNLSPAAVKSQLIPVASFFIFLLFLCKFPVWELIKFQAITRDKSYYSSIPPK